MKASPICSSLLFVLLLGCPKEDTAATSGSATPPPTETVSAEAEPAPFKPVCFHAEGGRAESVWGECTSFVDDGAGTRGATTPFDVMNPEDLALGFVQIADAVDLLGRMAPTALGQGPEHEEGKQVPGGVWALDASKLKLERELTSAGRLYGRPAAGGAKELHAEGWAVGLAESDVALSFTGALTVRDGSWSVRGRAMHFRRSSPDSPEGLAFAEGLELDLTVEGGAISGTVTDPRDEATTVAFTAGKDGCERAADRVGTATFTNGENKAVVTLSGACDGKGSLALDGGAAAELAIPVLE